MIRIRRAVVVEGKYDKIKLSSILDAVIIPTNGFSIYKDQQKQRLLRDLARERGLLVLTDSDRAGFQIRSFLRSICGRENIVDAYIPDLYGKERRKAHPSREGKLGVEGVPNQTLLQALRQALGQAGVSWEEGETLPPPPAAAALITKADLLRLGLTGGVGSAARRRALLDRLHLPEHLSTNSLLPVLNALTTLEQLEQLCAGEEGER